MKALKLTFRLLLFIILVTQVLLPFFIVVPSVNAGVSSISKASTPVLTIDVCSVKGKFMSSLSLMLPQGIFILVTILFILFYLSPNKPFILPSSSPEIFHPPTLL